MSTTLEGTIGGMIYKSALSSTDTFLEFTDGHDIPHSSYQVDSGSLGVHIRSTRSVYHSGIPSGHDTGTTRYFMEFDTSGITRAPANATFNPFLSNQIPYQPNDAAMVCVETKLETDGALEQADYDNHLNLGYTHKTYTEILPDDSTSIRHYMNFTQDGLDAIRDLDKLQMACLEAEYDYTRTEPLVGDLPMSNYTEFVGEIGAGDMGLGPSLTYTMRDTDKISSGKVNISSGKVTIK